MLLAQDAGGSGSPLDFLQYGVLGLIIIALLLGWLWAKPAVDGLIKRAEQAERQRDDLLKVYEERIMPTLIESTKVTEAMRPVMEEVVRALEDFRTTAPPRKANERRTP